MLIRKLCTAIFFKAQQQLFKKKLMLLAAVSLPLIIYAEIGFNQKPDLTIIKASDYFRDDRTKKVHFKLEIKNKGTAAVNINGVDITCTLKKNISVNANAGGTSMPDITLQPGQSTILQNAWFTYYDVDNLESYRFIVIHIDFNKKIGEMNETNNRKIFTYSFAKSTDLKLGVVSLSVNTVTDQKTGEVRKRYNFDCTIKNIGNTTAVLDNTNNLLVFQSSLYKLTCNGVYDGGAGGFTVSNVTQISPGQTITIHPAAIYTSTNPLQKITVEIVYYGWESKISNNKICITE